MINNLNSINNNVATVGVTHNNNNATQEIIIIGNNEHEQRRKLENYTVTQSLEPKDNLTIQEKVDSVLEKDDQWELSCFFKYKYIGPSYLSQCGPILHQAIAKESLKCVQFLIKERKKYNIKVNAREKSLDNTDRVFKGKPPIELAFEKALEKKNFKVLELLLSYSFIETACIKEVENFDNFLDVKQKTPLHYIVEQGCSRTLDFFLNYFENKIDVSQRDANNESAFDLSKKRSTEIYLKMRELLMVYEVDPVVKTLKNPLQPVTPGYTIVPLQNNNLKILDPQCSNIK